MADNLRHVMSPRDTALFPILVGSVMVREGSMVDRDTVLMTLRTADGRTLAARPGVAGRVVAVSVGQGDTLASPRPIVTVAVTDTAAKPAAPEPTPAAAAPADAPSVLAPARGLKDPWMPDKLGVVALLVVLVGNMIWQEVRSKYPQTTAVAAAAAPALGTPPSPAPATAATSAPAQTTVVIPPATLPAPVPAAKPAPAPAPTSRPKPKYSGPLLREARIHKKPLPPLDFDVSRQRFGETFQSHGFLRFLDSESGRILLNCPAVAVSPTLVAFPLTCTSHDEDEAIVSTSVKAVFVQIEQMWRASFDLSPPVRIPGFHRMKADPVSELIFFGDRKTRVAFAIDPLFAGNGPTIGLARVPNGITSVYPTVVNEFYVETPPSVLDISYETSCRYWLHDSVTEVSRRDNPPLTVDVEGCGFDITRSYAFIPGYVSSQHGAFRIRYDGPWDGFAGFYRPHNGGIVAVPLSSFDLAILVAAKRDEPLPEVTGRNRLISPPHVGPEAAFLFLSNRCSRDAKLTVYDKDTGFTGRENAYTLNVPAGFVGVHQSELHPKDFFTIGFAFDRAPNAFPYDRMTNSGRSVPAVSTINTRGTSYYITVPC